MTVTFSPNTPGPRWPDWHVEEGTFVNGRWVPGRRLAGDDTEQGQNLSLRSHPPDRIPDRIWASSASRCTATAKRGAEGDNHETSNFCFAALSCALSPSSRVRAKRVGPTASASDIPHLRKQGTATQLIVDGKPFLALAGELSNNSATSLEYMKPVWPKLVEAKLNTVLAGVSWNQIEPQEGKFDFSVLDGVIQGARSHNLRLVLLWFGSWKNGLSSYPPDWVKKDFERFPRAQMAARTAQRASNCSAPSATPTGTPMRAPLRP